MSFFDYLERRWDTLLQLTIDHAVLVLSAMAIATVIGVALGVATYRNVRLSQPTLSTCGLFLTIPRSRCTRC